LLEQEQRFFFDRMALVRSSCVRVVRRISPALSSVHNIHTSSSSSVYPSRFPHSSFRRSFAEQAVETAKPVTPPFENQGPRIVIYASNVAVITGDNPYGSLADVFESTWQKSFPDAFSASKAAAEVEKGEPIMNAEEQLMEDMKALGLSEEFSKTLEVATKADGTTQVLSSRNFAFGRLIDL